MPDQDGSLHRVRGFGSGVNWRLTKFASPVPHRITCGLCRVISRVTLFLPCFHTLCESCAARSVRGADIVCPFDGEAFTSGDCVKAGWPPTTVDKLKACCWNEDHGCTFVGTLQAVLEHYDEECIYHAMTCPRCSASVLNKDLPNHCRNGCPGKAIALAAEQPTERQGVEISAEDIAASLDELKALILDPNEDRLPALQSKINEVLEQARNIASQTKAIPTSLQEGDRSIQQTSGELSRTFRRELQSEESALCGNQKEHFQTQEILEQVKSYGKELDAVSRKLSDSENRLSNQLVQATQKLSETFVEEVRSQLTGLCAHLKKHLPINEISEQGKGHGMQVDAIASTLIESERRISDQLAKAAQELSATLVQNFESQQRELSDLLEAMFEEERSYAGEEEAATPYELPWRSEKKLILRKLELIGGETLAYLELLRTSADQQLKRPLVENTPVLPGYVSTPLKPPLIEQGEIKEFCYIVSITNVDDVVRSEKFIWLFTRWYHRDRYLQVTAHGLDLESSSGLAVCLKWGTTELNHFFLFPEAIVYVQHPDNVEESNLLLTRIGGAFGPWEFFLSDEAFLVEWEKVSSLGLVRGGKLTLVVAFRK